MKTCSLFFALLLICSSALSSNAQLAQDNRLLTYLSTQFDSCIVLQYLSAWDENGIGEYWIVAKSEQDISLFTYQNPYGGFVNSGDWERLSAGEMFFYRQDSIYKNTAPDTNRYLLPYRSAKPSFSNEGFWDIMKKMGLWQVQAADDKTAQGKCTIADGITATFYIMTKGTVRAVSFYEPRYYVEFCKLDDDNRKHALICIKQILSAFEKRP